MLELLSRANYLLAVVFVVIVGSIAIITLYYFVRDMVKAYDKHEEDGESQS